MGENILDKSLISIIVPVFNVELYLSRCIDSIIKQSYKNFELILINDGSNDGSGKICDDFSRLDTRIKVIHKKNAGVSSARNDALSMVSGKYVMFIDADDWIEEDTLDIYMRNISNYEADFLISEYQQDINNQCIPQTPDLCEGYLTYEQSYYKVINPNGFYGSVWGKLFLTEIIRDNNLRFNPDIRVGEDLLFTVNYLTYCKKVIYNPHSLYHYVVREGSALNNDVCGFDEKRLDIIRVYEIIMKNPGFLNSFYKNRVYSIYTRECIDWYCRMSSTREIEIKRHLKKKAIKYLWIFLTNNLFSIQTKCNSLIKLIFPKIVYKIKYAKS